MKTIVNMIFGSHLYGTDTPKSDKDFKGVFMPNYKDVLLGNIPKSINTSTNQNNIKNSSDDVDTETYSLHYFLKLACQGETVALDMLHAPDNMILEKSEEWDYIINNRSKFYTKDLRAFIDYAMKQAAKYGAKGSRLNSAKSIIDFINMFPLDDRLGCYWDMLPRDENIFNIKDSPQNVKQISICGKVFQFTTPIKHVLESINKFYLVYGDRARAAAENRNIDQKAVSHAFRAAYQVKSIFTKGTIIFPLPEAEFLKEVKSGSIDYSILGPMLDNEIDECKRLSEESSLPDKADTYFWDEFIINIYKELINGDNSR